MSRSPAHSTASTHLTVADRRSHRALVLSTGEVDDIALEGFGPRVGALARARLAESHGRDCAPGGEA